MSNLPSVTVETMSGHSWSTSMGPNVTKEQAENYFLNKFFDIGAYPEEKFERVVSVEYTPAEESK